MPDFAATCAMMAATCKIFTATRAILALTWFCHLSISLWSLVGWEFSIIFFEPFPSYCKRISKEYLVIPEIYVTRDLVLWCVCHVRTWDVPQQSFAQLQPTNFENPSKLEQAKQSKAKQGEMRWGGWCWLAKRRLDRSLQITAQPQYKRRIQNFQNNTNIHVNTNFTTIFMTHEMSQVFTLILNNGPCMLEGLSLLSYKIHLPNLFAELPNNDISKGWFKITAIKW